MNLRSKLMPYLFAVPLLFSSCSKKESPTEPAVNRPPVIERIVANPSEPFTRQAVSLECIANDPDSDNLTYDWRSDGGYFDNIDQRRTIWNSPADIGEYHLTAKVDDQKSGTASKTLSLDITSRFDTLIVSQDSFVDEYFPDDNSQTSTFGYREVLLVQMFSQRRQEFFLKYDFDSNKNIKSAKLRLTLEQRGMLDDEHRRILHIDIHKANNPWNEEVITWNNKPTYNMTPLKRFIAPSFSTDPLIIYVEDMQNIIENLMNNPSQNYGLVFVSAEGNTYKEFYSKEGAQEMRNMDYAPALILEYE